MTNIKTVLKLVEMVSDLEKLEWDDITVDGHIVTIEGTDYIILDEEEVQERMEEHLKETASYFNFSFLSSMTDLPEEVFEALIDKNEAVYKLIVQTCGVAAFIEECISVDGAGHFLNSYDGEEYELGNGLSAFNY
jgi:hypothetical protein